MHAVGSEGTEVTLASLSFPAVVPLLLPLGLSSLDTCPGDTTPVAAIICGCSYK